MNHIKKNVPVKRISPADGQYFFGYYDLQPFNENESLYLSHRTSFRDRLQKKGDTADLGFIDMKTEKFEKFSETSAWNFQQGAMLQWNPKRADREVIYNDLKDGEYCGVVMDIHSGNKRYLDRPVANVSRDGKYAININMARLYNFRPGYGYAFPEDPFFYKNHAKDDGIFITDMETGKSKLVLSLQQIWDATGSFFKEDQKLLINHITFNKDASRFIALVRSFTLTNGLLTTALITANRDGSDMYLLSDYGLQSHYWWMNNEDVIFFADGKELPCSRGWANTYIFKDKSHEGSLVENGFFERDNHMSFTEDNRLMITDTYPNDNRIQTLRLYSPEKHVCTDLGYFYSMPSSVIDVRCDLHPRWSRTEKCVTFDSTHEGFRGIYKIDITEDLLIE